MRTKTKPCGRCKEILELEAFAPSQRAKASTWCRACRREWDRLKFRLRTSAQRAIQGRARVALRKEFQELLRAHFETHPCVDCGERDMAVLEFDHVRGVKRAEVSEMAGYSLRSARAEIAKCEVRCGNCHRRKTIRERGHWLLEHDQQKAEA